MGIEAVETERLATIPDRTASACLSLIILSRRFAALFKCGLLRGASYTVPLNSWSFSNPLSWSTWLPYPASCRIVLDGSPNKRPAKSGALVTSSWVRSLSWSIFRAVLSSPLLPWASRSAYDQDQIVSCISAGVHFSPVFLFKTSAAFLIAALDAIYSNPFLGIPDAERELNIALSETPK